MLPSIEGRRSRGRGEGAVDARAPPTWNLGAEHPQRYARNKIIAKCYSKTCRAFLKNNDRNVFQQILQASIASTTVNLYLPIRPPASPLLPSINHKTLRCIPSSYWTILYDVMLPTLKRRFLFTCILDLHSRRSPNSLVGAVMSDRSDLRRVFKPKVSAK